MIIPIGHQERSVRRLPWVTLSLIAVCFVSFLLTDTSPEAMEGPDPLTEAADYWRAHAYLDAEDAIRQEVAYDVMPNQRSNYLGTLPNLAFQPEEDEILAAEQAELDRLTDLAMGRTVSEEMQQSTFSRYGLVPATLRPHAFFTHMFLHAGWLHLIGNMLFLFLAGPPLEDRWGRSAFLGFYLISGLCAAAIQVGLALPAEQHIPMVGASGAIAGLLGGFLVRLWSTQIRFAYFFMFGLRFIMGTFEAPAWAMLPLWFASELFSAWAWSSSGISSSVAYWAHVGGFATGVACAFGIRALRIEERWIDPAVDAQMTKFTANPVLQEAMDLREQGDVGQALDLLSAEYAREPNDEIALPLWDAALACQQPERGADAMALAIRTAAGRGELESALRHWSELSDHLPTVLVEPALLLRFIPVLLEEAQPDRVTLALRQAVHAENTPLTVGQALRVIELARPVDPDSTLRAARVALASADLHETKRGNLLQLVAELEAAGADATPLETEVENLEPPPEELPWGEDGAISLGRFAHAKFTPARPTGFSENGLQLAISPDKTARVEWSRIEAIAAVVVTGLGPRPVFVIDLLANWNDLEAEELRGVRLRSDEFDARALVPGAENASQALLALVAGMRKRSGATPLPSRAATEGKPFAQFPTLGAYEEEVLDVVG